MHVVIHYKEGIQLFGSPGKYSTQRPEAKHRHIKSWNTTINHHNDCYDISLREHLHTLLYIKYGNKVSFVSQGNGILKEDT